MFDPESFLDSTLPNPLDTRRTPVPVGTYSAFVEDVVLDHGIIKSGERAGQPWARLTFKWNIDDAALRDKLQRTKVMVSEGLMLDLDEAGDLDTRPGRNVRLGKRFEVFGLNQKGTSPRAFIGQFGKIRVEHRMYEGEPQEDVVSVAKG